MAKLGLVGESSCVSLLVRETDYSALGFINTAGSWC